MSESLIWWIDDDQTGDRKTAADTLGEQCEDLSTKFSKPDTASDELANGNNPNADLVLIDWKLNENEDAEYTARGLTMAATVREHLVDTPIYGFSSDSLENWSSPATHEQFQDRLEVNSLSSEYSAKRLQNDIEDYQKIEATRNEGFASLVGTLNPPDEIVSKLKALIPREFSSGLHLDNTKKGGSIVEFGEWVTHRFLKTPGPLLDDTWVATRLGIDKDAFEQYIETIVTSETDKLLYDGVFSHKNERLWWSSALIDAVVNLKDDDAYISQLNKDAPKILEVNSDDIASCSHCGEEFPDTVAAVLEGEDAKVPVHYHCSRVHHSREGSFEDYRVMTGSEE